MLPNEIERRTIYTILSKPVQRWQFLLGKYLGAVLALLLMIALMTVFMVALFWVFQKPPAEKVAEVATQPFMYWMEMSLLSAVGMFFSTFIAPLVNFFLTIGMWLVGTVLNPLYDTLAKNGQNGVMKGIAQIVTNVLPNFANYDTKNPIINPGQVIQNGALYKWSTVGYTAMYVGILLLLAIVVFDRREV